MEEPSADTVEKEFLSIQSIIKDFLVEKSNQHPIQDRWSYERGTGGGLSIVWEGKEGSLLEKGITCIFHAGDAGFFPPFVISFLSIYAFPRLLRYNTHKNITEDTMRLPRRRREFLRDFWCGSPFCCGHTALDSGRYAIPSHWRQSRYSPL
jgi:hypothetical protein